MNTAINNTAEHLDSLTLPGLNLEVYVEPAVQSQATALMRFSECLWAEFVKIAQEAALFEAAGLSPTRQTLEIDLHWVGSQTMHALNYEYRSKDRATDVLTFTLFAEQPDTTPWKALPVVQLGSIFVDIEWAEAECRQNAELNLERYLLERWVHGLLHLLGQHHDTMEKFHQVVQIQQSVLDAVFIQTDSCVSHP